MTDFTAVEKIGSALLEPERVTGRDLFLHKEEREALVPEREIRLRARENRKQVGPAREGAPGLGAVEDPAPPRPGGRHAQARDVRAVVRLGHGDPDHPLAARDAREPVRLLPFGASLEERARKDLRAGDEASGGAERATRELLGHEHHAEHVRVGF